MQILNDGQPENSSAVGTHQLVQVISTVQIAQDKNFSILRQQTI